MFFLVPVIARHSINGCRIPQNRLCYCRSRTSIFAGTGFKPCRVSRPASGRTGRRADEYQVQSTNRWKPGGISNVEQGMMNVEVKGMTLSNSGALHHSTFLVRYSRSQSAIGISLPLPAAVSNDPFSRDSESSERSAPLRKTFESRLNSKRFIHLRSKNYSYTKG